MGAHDYRVFLTSFYLLCSVYMYQCNGFSITEKAYILPGGEMISSIVILSFYGCTASRLGILSTPPAYFQRFAPIGNANEEKVYAVHYWQTMVFF